VQLPVSEKLQFSLFQTALGRQIHTGYTLSRYLTDEQHSEKICHNDCNWNS